jgi:HEAT repeat protein
MGIFDFLFGKKKKEPAVPPHIQALIQDLGDEIKQKCYYQGYEARYARMGAAKALREIGEPAVEPLIRALEQDRYIAMGAAKALGEIGEPAVEPLIRALENVYFKNVYWSWEVREGAAIALGDIRDPRAVEVLTQALKDDDEHVREAAKEALEKVKKE